MRGEVGKSRGLDWQDVPCRELGRCGELRSKLCLSRSTKVLMLFKRAFWWDKLPLAGSDRLRRAGAVQTEHKEGLVAGKRI